MRIIDADALREQAVSYVGLGDIILVGQLDAAPTISCEACKHHDAEAGTHRWQRCAGCYCASNFQRRQP